MLDLMKGGKMNKVKTPGEAISIIQDGDTLAVGGSGGGIGEPTSLLIALRDRFLKTGHPRDLTIFFTSGLGDWRKKGENKVGLEFLAEEGLVRRAIGGHFGANPTMLELILQNKIEAYNFPQGVLAQLYRAIAGKRPGVITQVGIGTYVDPRIGGGRLNEKTKEDLVEVITLNNQDWLLYKALSFDAAVIRGTTADEEGNITLEEEAAILGALSRAQATHNSGGKVIAQVKRLAKRKTLDPRFVKIPGCLVDVIVVEKNQWQNCERFYDPSLNGEIKMPLESIPPIPLTERKVIARRAAMEIAPNNILNLGVGMPDGVASIVAEEGLSDYVTLTIEQGAVGGIPQGGIIFGCSANPEAIVEDAMQFDLYDGGGLDACFLGFVQVDEKGNVNASRLGTRLAGACGGFINISQGAQKVVFCGTLTAGGLKVGINNGKLKILTEGKNRKFVKCVEEITFSGKFSKVKGQKVIYVTERALFELGADGIILKEVAPGIDVRRDVLPQIDFKPRILKPLKQMDSKIFHEGLIGLRDVFGKEAVDATA
jgi:propionate CoA-transferase